MASVETKIAHQLLRLIRAKQVSSSAPQAGGSPSSRDLGADGVKCREVGFSDFEPVRTLKRKVGLGPDNPENWQRLWRHNPALGQWRELPCMGWVLEGRGKIVGYLGSIPLLYRYGTRTLTAAAAHGLAVEPEFRALTLSLVARFYRQPNIDLLLNTTADPAAGKIAMGFKARPLPQVNYGTVLFWVLDAHAFTNQVVKKLGVNGVLGNIGSALGALALRGDIVLQRRLPRGRAGSLDVREISVRDIGEEFLPLWEKRVAGKPQVLAYRTPSIIRWHFAIPGGSRTNTVLVCYNRGRLVGYIVLSSEFMADTGYRCSTIADMLVDEDNPEVIRRLLVAAYEHTKDLGNHVLEVLGFPKVIRHVCVAWKPHSREYPACPYFYKISDQTLRAELVREDAWYACPYDGDGTLMP